MGNTRTAKAFKNIYYGIVTQILTISLNFILRTIFIKFLSIEYLGINGLFTNIITILSLSELGIGISMTYSLYKPLAKKNYSRVNAIINLMRKIYTTIGLLILILGLGLIPFLKFFIADYSKFNNLNLLYFLFLLNTVCSYICAHYRNLLTADQQEFVNQKNRSFFKLLLCILQIVILYKTKNFFLYLGAQIIITIIENFWLSTKVKKKYPFLKSNHYEKLEFSEIREMFKFTLGAFSQKIGYTILSSTDNIVISRFMGSYMVGVLSNYLMIITTIKGLIYIIVNSVQASIGNLVAESTVEKEEEVFYRINFIYSWIYGVSSILLVILLPDFISIWVGDKFILDRSIINIIILNFYLVGMRQAVATFITAKGLLWYLKFKPIFEVIINLLFSVILIKKIGIKGVFLGTMISTLLTSFWYEPFVLFRKGFNVNTNKYFNKYAQYILILFFSWILAYKVSGILVFGGISALIIKGIIAFLSYNFIYFIFLKRSDEYKYCYKKILNKYKKLRNKKIGLT